jgi:hypothetical protein
VSFITGRANNPETEQEQNRRENGGNLAAADDLFGTKPGLGGSIGTDKEPTSRN